MDDPKQFVGLTLDGRYKIERVVGIGGMAFVYEATDDQTGNEVALKLLKEKDGVVTKPDGEEKPELVCKNSHCITKTERGIKRLYKGESCIYCDQKAVNK